MRRQTDDDQEPTPEDIRKTILDLKHKGLIVDSGRCRKGQIVWITAEQAEVEKRKIN